MTPFIFGASFLCSLAAVALKVFQQKNVIGNHLKAAFLTSCVMGLFDVATVTLIVKGGWWIAVSSGTGAGLGLICSVKLHNRIFKPKVAT